MGTTFSICMCKNKSEIDKENNELNDSEYKVVHIENKIYVFFKNKQVNEWLEI